ncbi:hypothetical protein GON26_18440 [Flavobacterium sp. GA093]|uniref:Uncharacterized protein n=1 Tax=Flavobacterium hydrocarbonoxydans TaxID=2683249 RepID=A0A6I4NPF3_9FLAO|nr:hypothetical protein [Flavobacterium hydrocarbonoxydans]MWB96346.1 hypothetical protein [Flavobacterium hydrocarbonoxydans]
MKIISISQSFRIASLLMLIFISFSFSAILPKSGIEIYGIKGNFQNEIKNCQYCFNEKSIILSEKPLLDESDINYFDWKNQQIILSETGKSKISKLKIQLSGMPVVMVLNKKVIYGFWFWNIFSSFGCDRVYTYPEKDFKIKFGLPLKNTFGTDPRYNRELEKYILNRFPQK